MGSLLLLLLIIAIGAVCSRGERPSCYEHSAHFKLGGVTLRNVTVVELGVHQHFSATVFYAIAIEDQRNVAPSQLMTSIKATYTINVTEVGAFSQGILHELTIYADPGCHNQLAAWSDMAAQDPAPEVINTENAELISHKSCNIILYYRATFYDVVLKTTVAVVDPVRSTASNTCLPFKLCCTSRPRVIPRYNAPGRTA